MIKRKIKFVETFYQIMLKFFREKIIELPLEPILHPSSKRIFLLGLCTFIGHPLFYWLWGYFLPQPYENLWLRTIFSLSGIILMLPYINRNPHSRTANISFLTIFFIQMPFFFTWMYLCNGGNPVWLASISMMVLICYHATDWRLATAGLILGSAVAWLFFNAIGPETTPLSNEILLTNAIVIAFSFCMAFVLGTPSVNEQQLIKKLHKEREQALVALAGSIAHEMRNPLGQIKYALDHISHLLPTSNTSNADHVISAKIVNDIYTNIAQGLTSCDRGLQVIDTTLHEVSNQKFDTTTFKYLSAVAITEKAIKEYSFESPDERNRVSLHCLNDFTFKVDETTYIYIIFNLLKNALYYFQHYPDARITIAIDHHKITITDTGPGIPLPILNKLFNDFTTAEKTDGTGLGLAYCHRAMQSFNGKISCESVVGQYTKFTLTFPVISQEEIEAYTKAVFQEAIPLFKYKRLLVVDDQVIYPDSVRQMLKELHCQIDGAEDGQTAISLLRENDYDLIVMDLIMPGKDGCATTEEIRSGIVPHQKNIAILAHTSELSDVTRIKTKKAGMDGFIGKPCTQLELIKAICQAMECAGHRNAVEKTDGYLAGKTVLIADDALVNRQYLEIYTREWGMHALHATNGKAVLDVLEKTPQVDIVFMDMEMPVVNGVEAARRIRANPAHRNLIIVALTGNFSEQSIEDAKTSGMNDFITKPFDKKVLRQKLVQLITARNQRQKTQAPLSTDSSTNSKTLIPVTKKIDAGISNAHTYLSDKKTSATHAEIKALTDFQSNRYIPEYPNQELFFKDMPLIDYAQLISFQTNFNDRFQEFLQRFINDLLERDKDLQNSFNTKNRDAMLKALHSLVGFAGYVGAHCLQQYIRLRLYSALSAGHLPDEEAWVETVHALVKNSVDVLRREYVKEQRETD